MTKRIWRAEGLPRRRGTRLTVRPPRLRPLPRWAAHDRETRPEGSTIGLTKVTALDSVAGAYALAAQHDTEVLCEQFVSGDEVTIAVLGTGAAARALPLIRIVAPEGNYDYQNKYFTDTTQYLVPAGLPAGEEEAIQQLVLQAYRVLAAVAGLAPM